jgi:PAS domain S-box-containing protein
VPPNTQHSAESQLVRLVEAAPDAILEVDAQGRIAFANTAAEKLFGYTRDELRGMEVERLVPAAARSGHTQQREGYMRHPRTRPMGIGMELKAQRKDGTLLPVEISLSPSSSEAGLGVIAVIRDITERFRIEEKLRQSEDRLRQAEKLESLARLAGGTAHEFNNLLTMVLGYSELLQPAVANREDAASHLERIRTAAKRAADLTRQLLAFGRRQMLIPQVLDLNTLVADVGRVLSRVVGEAIRISVAPASRPAWVRADAAQIEQLIANLVINSRDAMPYGGSITLAVAEVQLNDEQARQHPGLSPGHHVLLSVRDTGAGMTPEVQARIFEPFFSTRQLGKAAGLGLATVYGIVSQSGGSISVESTLGVGTTFTVYLPRLTEGKVEHPGSSLPHIAELTGSETILLVEDQPHLLALAREFLERLGYTVLSAASAEQALQVTRDYSGRIHLLLTDIVMPGMNGRELAQVLKSERRGLKVLYVSGYTDEAFGAGTALKQGEVFLEKPFELETLGQRIRELLTRPAAHAGAKIARD